MATEEETLKFYADHGVPDVRSKPPYRFIRFNPSFQIKESLQLLKKELPEHCHNQYPMQVPWLKDYYALPGEFSLSQTKIWNTGRVYGQDVSSGAAVTVLMDGWAEKTKEESLARSESLRVLDMCCCPGLKLCAIADELKSHTAVDHVVVGVDISQPRMNVCKKIVKKYQIEGDHQRTCRTRIRLYCNDGATFGKELNLVYDSKVASQQKQHLGERKRLNKSARAREKSLLRESAEFDLDKDGTLKLFDRVLVDAECSTDGSIIHTQKRVENGWSNTTEYCNPKLADESSIVDLQKSLLSRGFELLKAGGVLVYSTCSLSEKQNEDVVRWLLEERSTASIVPVKFEQVDETLLKEGTLPGTLRFIPNTQNARSNDDTLLYGGGFFLAKLKRIQ